MTMRKFKRSGRVKISYLPGFGPRKTQYPFAATINGKPATVWPDRIEHHE